MPSLTLHSPWRRWFRFCLVPWFTLLGVGLLLGLRISPVLFLIICVSTAAVQALFFERLAASLDLERSVQAGVKWGAISGAFLFVGQILFFTFLRPLAPLWLLIAVGLGGAVGGLAAAAIESAGESAFGGSDLPSSTAAPISARWGARVGAIAFVAATAPRSVNALLASALVGGAGGAITALAAWFLVESGRLSRRAMMFFIVLTVVGGVAAAFLCRAFRRQYLVPLPLGTLVASALTVAAPVRRERQLSRRGS